MGFYSSDQKKILSILLPEKSAEYDGLLESFGEFVEKEIAPSAKRIDRDSIFPKENMDKIFAQGFTSIPYPPELGGLNLPYLVYVVCMEMLGRACASTAISLAIHGTMCDGLYQFGSKSQHKDYLKDLISGRKLGAFALTEPNAGSDARAMETWAELNEDKTHWSIKGSKMFITNSGKADYYLVFTKTGAGFASLLVPKDSPGFSHGANIPKMGLHGSTLMGLTLDKVYVPRENLVGTDGEGFEYAKKMLLGGRITIASLSVGIAEAALQKTIAYVRDRKAFGRSIADFGITKAKIADMMTEITAARHLTYYAALLKGKGDEFAKEACKAKLYSSEMSLRVCNEAIQLHGGYGYTDEADVHRHWRDAKLMTIGEGTSEIMKIIISSNVL